MEFWFGEVDGEKKTPKIELNDYCYRASIHVMISTLSKQQHTTKKKMQ